MGTLHPMIFRESSEKNIFTHSHRIDQIELLVNDAQAPAQRLNRCGMLNDLPIKLNRTLILFIDAGQNLHQCRFSCSIFSNNSIYHALGDFQRYFIQRQNTRKSFRYAADLQYQIFFLFH